MRKQTRQVTTLQQQAPRIFTPPRREPTTSSMPHGGESWALSCPACRERCAVDHARMVCCTYLCEVGHAADPDRGTASQHSNIVSQANHVVGPMQPGTQTLSAFVIARLDEALARRVALGRRISCPPDGWGLGPDQGAYVIKLKWLAPSHILPSAGRVICGFLLSGELLSLLNLPCISVSV